MRASVCCNSRQARSGRYGVATLVLACLSPATALAQGPKAPGVRRPVAVARSVEQLLTRSKDPLVRETAAQVLGLRGSAESVPLLINRLAKDDNLWVRARAAEALGTMGSPAAIRPLRSALAREKSQRVRRMIGMALVRLGQRTGVEELMWQLKAGTNHTRADVMAFLVQVFGQPLGQKADSWWAYLSDHGYEFLAHRPGGVVGLDELKGLDGNPRLFSAKTPPAWRRVPAFVLRLPPPVTSRQLRLFEGRNGPLPDGCLLLIHTGWRGGKSGARAAPGLTIDAVRHLLKRAPKLVGVSIDTPTLDPPTVEGHPGRDLLVGQGRLVLEGVTGMEHLPDSSSLLIVDRGSSGDSRRALVLGLMP